MKRLALFAAAALLASPAAFAQDQDLCELNMAEVDQHMTTSMATMGEPARTKVEGYIETAEEAQATGDTDTCIAQSTMALQILKGPGGSDAGSAAGGASGGGQ
ncbi:hypothetical protein [Stutzerimonas tarimensis]|uniref:UrcA family protein n=1 Tax=Stutzerimonas tarimensis TaxID=1507735 RepID=A0ABV7SZU6_9GAMM